MKIIDVNETDIDGLTIRLDKGWSIHIRYVMTCCEAVYIADSSIAELKEIIGHEVNGNITDMILNNHNNEGILYFFYDHGDFLHLKIITESDECCCNGGTLTVEYVKDMSDAINWSE